MTWANIWLVIKTLLIITPAVVEMVRDGKVKSGAQQDILNALAAQMDARLKAAQAAGEGELPDEESDPNNRA